MIEKKPPETTGQLAPRTSPFVQHVELQRCMMRFRKPCTIVLETFPPVGSSFGAIFPNAKAFRGKWHNAFEVGHHKEVTYPRDIRLVRHAS